MRDERDKFCYFVICVLCCFLNIYASDEYPSVKVNQGILNGMYMKSDGGNMFSSFMGIPYAKPPVNELRFKAPQTADSWDGVFEATKPHPVCTQIETVSENPTGTGSEDCLYLNVFTPQKSSSEQKMYPVMVYIHGGGFFMGTGQIYGPNILMDYNIVYVNINYRLGALGFLSTGDDVVPGNNGLKDQVMALKWINKNIHHFGGDSNKITLFGQSAGGASVHYHMLSPLSKGLFQYAISQSGTALNPWALGKRDVAVNNGKLLAEALNCPTEDSHKMVDCLKKIDPYKFIEMEKIFMKWELEPLIPFRPVIEISHKGAFLTKHPIDILKAGKHYQVPWITGITTEEGAFRSAMLYKTPDRILDLDANFESIMSIITEGKEIDFDKLRKYYFGDKKINDNTRLELADLFSDFVFNVDARKAALLHRKYSNQPVYFYLFGHKSSVSFSQIFGDSHYYGTCHGDDSRLQFPLEMFFGTKEKSSIDKKSSELLNTLFTNFARTGNPTPEINAIIQSKWEPVTTEEFEYSFIERNIHNSKHFLLHRMKLWDDFDISVKHEEL